MSIRPVLTQAHVHGRRSSDQVWRRLVEDLERHGVLGARGAAAAIGPVAEDVRRCAGRTNGTDAPVRW